MVDSALPVTERNCQTCLGDRAPVAELDALGVVFVVEEKPVVEPYETELWRILELDVCCPSNLMILRTTSRFV